MFRKIVLVGAVSAAIAAPAYAQTQANAVSDANNIDLQHCRSLVAVSPGWSCSDSTAPGAGCAFLNTNWAGVPQHECGGGFRIRNGNLTRHYLTDMGIGPNGGNPIWYNQYYVGT